MEWKTEKHPLNAKGRFYVDQKSCILDGCCETAAPNNFVYDEKTGSGYYISKQPETAEELKQMREAIYCCPTEAIYDDGETKSE